MAFVDHQSLPRTGPDRENLRSKGQFWTPAWIAEAMVAYVLRHDPDHIFDPAVGGGAFLLAAKKLRAHGKRTIALLGSELYAAALAQARKNGLTDEDLAKVDIRDFVLDPPPRCFSAIVANPPYIRHHRLDRATKEHVARLSRQMLGVALDGRAGLHAYFLLQALNRLQAGGRLAFILPADTFEGVFATRLWSWIAGKLCIDAVVTFDPEASPFPGVDTNAIVVLIQKQEPKRSIVWARCEAQGADLRRWFAEDLKGDPPTGVMASVRDIAEALAVGLSRLPVNPTNVGPPLSQFGRVMRGIATGANDFFFMTSARIRDLGLPLNYFVRAIGRTRDVPGGELKQSDLEELDANGRPTYLLSLSGTLAPPSSPALKKYISEGERHGYNSRVLIATRNPWYRMETRTSPPILFAYLGRRNSRFVLNLAGAVPLTGFLCVYPADNSETAIMALWRVLNHGDTLANLRLVGKSYGGGAVKVEPRALERLPIPLHLIESAGLRGSVVAQQGELL